MSREKNSASNEHTLNIRTGLATLKTLYGLSIDEYDYIDIAIDSLRDIRHFGTTLYMGMAKVRADGSVLIPCNAESIDAVTTRHMAKKAFPHRVRTKLYDPEADGDFFYSFENNIQNTGFIGNVDYERTLPGLADRWDTGYISYTLFNGKVMVDKELAGESIGIAYTGLSVDIEGYPMITRKQANALAAITAKVLALKGAHMGNKVLASMLEYFTTQAARLKQAASIAEDISDNEIDELLDAKTTFNRKAVNRPTKYSR